MSAEYTTSRRHNDYVGGDASAGRIPGADEAQAGHYYNAVFPKGMPPFEHLPPTTGRDAPPSGGIRQSLPGVAHRLLHVDQQTDANVERLTTVRQPGEVQPLPPAPDSRTVIDRDPYATPTSAGDTLTGATSADVYTGLGHPGAGMSSAEAHHDGRSHRKRQQQGVSTFGSGEIPREIQSEAEQP
ncbi:hypothetical protein WOLCODRAFT_77879 [Wolfiporia cocos MD-104 SS10]|uniref:Uncharacterized protein n=1 Tax=Wolfiporia cocos (strain MD-104) TaxID=742152 RepID=A0A2H3K9D7_WOLCO|nr:hypothetical protein WOLCODRAFT_77879 [Wolfiporia cocos MD-104 SS10]